MHSKNSVRRNDEKTLGILEQCKILYDFSCGFGTYGGFYTEKSIGRRILRYILVGYAYKVLTCVIDSESDFSFFSDAAIPWFMFVLAFHTLLRHILHPFALRKMMLPAITASLIAGFFPVIGDSLYLSLSFSMD